MTTVPLDATAEATMKRLSAFGGETTRAVSRLLQPPSFGSLAEALKFLAANLDDDNIAAIAMGCAAAGYEWLESDSESAKGRVASIRALRRRHSSFSLRWRYWWRRFPRKSTELTLSLGHVHVAFVRVGPAWKLWEICMTR